MRSRLLSCLVVALAAVLLPAALASSRSASGSRIPVSPSWDPACYRTYEEIDLSLRETAGAYPAIASLFDAGPSWEGTRNLSLLRLGSERYPGPKPSIFLLGGQQPRDIATPELLLRLVTHLTRNYDVDPEATWLLDRRTIWVLPLPNPDGYYQVYHNGFASWAKNTDNANGCGDPRNWGTNLAYNYPFHWSAGGAACDPSYPGPSALSEPESRAVLSAFDASGAGLAVSLQSPGPGVLYPWGWTSEPPPLAGELDALGWNLGRLSGSARDAVHPYYTAGQPLYGLFGDTVYGQHGAPAYTLLLGTSHSPACAEVGVLWEAARPALLYAAAVAGPAPATTLSRAFGPAPRDLSVSYLAGGIQATGVLSANYGTVAGAVYAIDEPGEDGSGVQMEGSFGGGAAPVWAAIDTTALPNGRHTLFVQGVDQAGHWGGFSAVFFTVSGNSVTPSPTPVPVTRTTTPTPWPSPTSTAQPSSTPTATSSATLTPTPTTTVMMATAPPGTRTPTISPTSTATRTPVPTRTPVYTRTSTSTRTPTITRTITSTPTITLSPTPRPPNSPTPLPCFEYADVHPDQYFYRAVDWLTCHGLVSGYPDGTFRPFNTATRAQVLKIVVLGEGWPLYAPPSPHFTDVPRGSTFYSYVETALAHAVISGYGDGTFRPNLGATRGQLARMLYVALTQPPGPMSGNECRVPLVGRGPDTGYRGPVPASP